MTGDLIRVLLADDHAVVRAGLKAVLGAAPDIDIVGEAKDGREAVALVERLNPDVVVMDLSMGGLDGTEATKEIVAKNLPARVLILTMHAEEDYLVPLLEAGAAGYLVKSAADRELVDAVRAVNAGEVYVRPSVARFLAASIRGHPTSPTRDERLTVLSDRERTVVELLAEGYNGPEIGDRLGISAKTVETYKQRIGDKLGIEHRAEFVRFALEVGLLHR
jgi:two-component system, NarL family, response regulator NreC